MKKLVFIMFLVILTISLILTGCGKAEPAASSTTAAATAATSAATSQSTSNTQPVAQSSTPAKTSTPAAAPAQTASSTPKYGGKLTIIVAENPTAAMGIPSDLRGQSPFYVSPCLEPLLGYNQNGEAVGILASGWKLAPDLSYFEISLRQGVKFQDGTDFNADAAKWNLDYMMQQSVSGTADWKSVDLIDDHTVRINLKSYSNTLMQDLTWNTTAMISPTAFKTNGAEWAKWNPVGTGPFKWVGYQTDKYIEFSRFDGYWGGKPYLEGVKFIIIPDMVTAEIALQSGEGNAIFMIGRWNDVARDLVPEGYKAEGTTYGMRGLVADSANASSPLSKLKVREALEYAINRPKIAEAIGYGYLTALEQASCPHTNGWILDYKGRSYNPDKAKQLLAEAGYSSGLNITIYGGVHLTGNELTAIQADFKAVGVTADVQVTSIAKWLDQEANGWQNAYYSAGLTSLGSEVDYGTWLKRYWMPTSGRFPCMERSSELVAAMKAGLAEPDLAKQKELYQKVNKLLYENALFIPLWYDKAVWTLDANVMDTGVGGWLDPSQPSFGKTWIDK